ncbi:unnamed protein product [Kluyveromyces dobzhanskii CBS 2104]|uniref:WGS project CCBQ000000000 data, contig 00015 n=1 Tax=Kluyveromyces dobzhanskii CBS 2104 TaxID=1427455 RepID=A0A0A8LBL8_9SACH|nr:unnamed protein product [Kluyveromyces dobzhanskii CBS 2104]
MTRLPNIDEFKSSPIGEQVNVLDTLFEHSDSLVWFTLKNSQFMRSEWNSYQELVKAVETKLLQVCEDTEIEGISSRGVDHLANIVGAHPRLGDSKQNLSSHSKQEQANLTGSANKSPEVLARLNTLNQKYETKYEGLKFVVFVNGRSYDEISEVMEKRIHSNNSWFKECEIAIKEMSDIAVDRLNKCVEIKGKI